MKLTKINAVLALLLGGLFAAHLINVSVGMFVGYETVGVVLPLAYLTGLLILAHAVISILLVGRVHGGNPRIRYAKQNVSTILQRDMGLLTAVLFFVHVPSGAAIARATAVGDAVLPAVWLILFFGVSTVHLAVSLHRVLLTFGWLPNGKTETAVKVTARILCGGMFVAATAATLYRVITLATGV